MKMGASSMLITLMALFMLGAAQTPAPTVFSVFLPDTDPQALVGSVISMDSSLTTLAVACRSPIDQADCGYPQPVTVTVGPTTFHAVGTVAGLSAYIDCNLNGSISAVCHELVTGASNVVTTDAVDTTTTLGSTDITFFPVTITAGFDYGNGSVVNATTTPANSTYHSMTTTGGTMSGSSASATTTESMTLTSRATMSGTSATVTGGAFQTTPTRVLDVIASFFLVALGILV